LAARRKSASAAMARRRASAKIWTTKSRSEAKGKAQRVDRIYPRPLGAALSE